MMPSFKIAQIVPLNRTGGLPELQKEIPEPLVQIQNNFIELFLCMYTLYKNCTNCSASMNKRAARAPGKNYLEKTSPEPLVQIQNNFTELFLCIPSTKIAQMVLLR